MVYLWDKKCLRCGKPFRTRIRSQVYCSRVCSGAAHRGKDCAKLPKPAPPRVYIRITRPIPVWPEFQLELGGVYEAEKYQSCEHARASYIVRKANGVATLVRMGECEEVQNAAADI